MQTGRRIAWLVLIAGVLLLAAPARGQDVLPTNQPEPPPAPVAPEKPPVAGDVKAAKPDKDERRSIAEDTTIRLRAGAWLTSLQGNLSAGQAFPGTISDIDLIETLNLDPDQTVFQGSVGVNFGPRFHFDLGYGGPLEFEGTSDPIDISFNGFVFSGTTTTQVDLDIYNAEFAYDAIEAGPLTVTFGFGVRVFDFSATLTGIATDPNTGQSQTQTESVEAIVPLPFPGIGVRWDLTKRFYLRGALRGIYAGDYGNYFDAVGEVGFDITRNVGLYGGYRWMHAEADVSDVRFNVDLDGPYVGVEVRF